MQRLDIGPQNWDTIQLQGYDSIGVFKKQEKTCNNIITDKMEKICYDETIHENQRGFLLC